MTPKCIKHGCNKLKSALVELYETFIENTNGISTESSSTENILHSHNDNQRNPSHTDNQRNPSLNLGFAYTTPCLVAGTVFTLNNLLIFRKHMLKSPSLLIIRNLTSIYRQMD